MHSFVFYFEPIHKTEERFIFTLLRKLRFGQLKWFIQCLQQSQVKLRSPGNRIVFFFLHAATCLQDYHSIFTFLNTVFIFNRKDI